MINKKIGLFIGTERGYIVLKELILAGYNNIYALILIQKDNENNIYHHKIINYCKKNNIKYKTSHEIKSNNYYSFIKENCIDIIFLISWRFLVNKECFNVPRYGIFVLHDSLLPKYRGFSPTNWVLINGEKETGLTLQIISEDMDAGKIVDQKKVNIDFTDDANTLNKKITQLYPKIILENLENIYNNNIELKIQDENKSTYTCKRILEDGKLNFNKNSIELYNLIRGQAWPYFGTYCYIDGKEMIYIWEAEILKTNYIGIIPGRVVLIDNYGVGVLCGDGNILKIKKISLENKKNNFISPNKVIKSITTTLS